MKDTKSFDTDFNPPKGTEECDHCNGYGSSLKDPIGVDKCTKCKGSGLMPKKGDK
jgi:DnaJ-class molecular chaperone